jgi:hypothetical protein
MGGRFLGGMLADAELINIFLPFFFFFFFFFFDSSRLELASSL